MGGRILVPNSAALHQGANVMTQANWPVPGSGEVDVVFHPRFCFMQPWAIAALAAWAEAHTSLGGTIRVTNPEKPAYAWRMGLGAYLGYTPPPVRAREEAGRFLALRRVAKNEDLKALLPSIATLLHVEGESATAIIYTFSELIRNSLEHAESGNGALVCAQHYKGQRSSRNYVSIGVADTGIGIRESLSRAHDIPDDLAAVRTAIRPGITGALPGLYGTSDNAGAGLFVTSQLARETLSEFGLASGGAFYLATRTGGVRVKAVPRYPGTVVAAEVGVARSYDYAGMLSDAWGVLGRGDLADQMPTDDVRGRISFQ